MPSRGKYIHWDNGGGFGPDDWRVVYRLIRDHVVRTVIEYGCGLSTELMMAVGMKVTSIETVHKYADIPDAVILECEYGKYPEFYKMFDLAFVDGPGAYEFESKGIVPERRLSAEHAKRHSNLVYMHDGGLGQEECFKDDPEWTKIGGEDTGQVWRRR